MRDIDVRRALLAKMDRLHPDRSDTRIIEELGICQGIARVDLAVINGTVHGYEIKSERDTLARLKGQAQIYSEALEFVTIVAAASHLNGVRAQVPAWWGIWSATPGPDGVILAEEREASRNPSLLPSSMVQFLWRDEAFDLLLQRNLSSGLSGKSRRHIWDRVTAALSPDELSEEVRSRLKQRPADWRVHAQQA